MSGQQTGRQAGERPGYELPLLLLTGFRELIEALHGELALRGHEQVRPAHGFALQAIGQDGVTASELGRRLGVSKQAAGKTVERLAALGYAERVGDEQDGRRKLVRLTDAGLDVLTQSAAIFEDLRAWWRHRLGARRMAEFEAALRELVAADGFALDVLGWFGQ